MRKAIAFLALGALLPTSAALADDYRLDFSGTYGSSGNSFAGYVYFDDLPGMANTVPNEIGASYDSSHFIESGFKVGAASALSSLPYIRTSGPSSGLIRIGTSFYGGAISAGNTPGAQYILSIGANFPATSDTGLQSFAQLVDMVDVPNRGLPTYFRLAQSSVAGDVTSAILTPIAPVPEPEAWALMLTGLGVLGFLAWRKRSGSSGPLLAA